MTVNPGGSVTQAPNSIILAWPINNAGFTLQSATILLPVFHFSNRDSSSWEPVDPACSRATTVLIYWAMRHGERSLHVFMAAVAHIVVLSEWQLLQAFGMCRASVMAG